MQKVHTLLKSNLNLRPKREVFLASLFLNQMNNLFTSCVVKIASRCNLNCTYCYMYNKGDNTYLSQPKFLSHATIEKLMEKLDVYLSTYTYNDFNFVFHGGEPMLASRELYEFFIESSKELFSKHKKIPNFSIQTNGVLIDREWTDFFKKHDIHVGISLDTTKNSNDLNRIYHNGKSSYDDIINGFNVFNKEMGYKAGILSVIDINQNPVDVYNHYIDIGVESVNLLFPDDTYDDGYVDDLTLGKWLAKIFDLWLNDKKIQIDQFEILLNLLYGADSNIMGDEYYGTRYNNTFIIETDGEIQANDPLRVCFPEIHKTKLNVNKNNIYELLNAPLSHLYYNAKKTLCKKCEDCLISDICSGGYLINRYSKMNGFDNPSIYCKSLAFFITYVQNKVADYTNSKLKPHERIEKIDINEMLKYCETKNVVENHELSRFKKK